MSVKIFLANGFEEIEAFTVVDLLKRADIDIKMVSMNDNNLVIGGHNIKVIADEIFNFEQCKNSNMIILPGGAEGVNNLKDNKELIELIKFYNENKKYIGAICAAPKILGEMNILQGKKATSYPSFISYLKGAEISGDSVVLDGNIITSVSVKTAIDFSLKIIEVISGKEKANEIKKSIVY